MQVQVHEVERIPADVSLLDIVARPGSQFHCHLRPQPFTDTSLPAYVAAELAHLRLRLGRRMGISFHVVTLVVSSVPLLAPPSPPRNREQ